MFLTNYKLGLIGEYVIMFYLILKGYKILSKRYKNCFGEIDLLTLKKNKLVAFEIKSSRNKITSERVTSKQLNRIKKSLDFFVSKNQKYNDCNILIKIILFYNYFKIKEIEVI